jgi:hypothetical protein
VKNFTAGRGQPTGDLTFVPVYATLAPCLTGHMACQKGGGRIKATVDICAFKKFPFRFRQNSKGLEISCVIKSHRIEYFEIQRGKHFIHKSEFWCLPQLRPA